MLVSQGHGDPPPYAQDVLALDPEGVHRLFADLGFPHYRDQLAGEPLDAWHARPEYAH